MIDSKTRPALEKQIAIYLIRRHTGLTNGEIGKIFKMKAQAVSKAGIKIEKLMEDNRRIRNQVNKLISIFEACPLCFCLDRRIIGCPHLSPMAETMIKAGKNI